MADQIKLVLIEDDREISTTLQRVLEAAGYTLLRRQQRKRRPTPDRVVRSRTCHHRHDDAEDGRLPGA